MALTVILSTMYYYIVHYSTVPYGKSYYKVMVKLMIKKLKIREVYEVPLSTMYYYIVWYGTI